MVSKLEINIRTLLTNCEELAKEESNFWSLKRYIKSLNTMIEELEETNKDISYKTLSDYKERLLNLKTSANYIDSPPAEKKLKKFPKSKETGDGIIREINQIHNSNYYSNIRKELMDDDNLRKRVTPNDDSMGQAVKYYTDYQEKITEDMLSLTRSLREQTETANRIIKRDTEIVGKSTALSDNNLSSLSKEAEKLQDHSRKAWKCWMWIMIGLVMMIFIFMVLFMKIMKKKTL